MIQIKSSVGKQKFKWKTAPRGREGVGSVELESGVNIEVRWKRDEDGIWLQLPHGIFGFDLRAGSDDFGRLSYSITQRMNHAEWNGISTVRGEDESLQGGRTQKAKVVRIRAQMPGKIIRVLVEADQVVQKDQPIVVMEAMKMENEIRAPLTGKVTQIKAVEGQAVETGADLLLIDGQNLDD
jgi:biotin carboxyl carrier protein